MFVFDPRRTSARVLWHMQPFLGPWGHLGKEGISSPDIKNKKIKTCHTANEQHSAWVAANGFEAPQITCACSCGCTYI